jgi:hypothetical protein
MITEPKGELQRTMAWKNVDRKRGAHLAWARRTFNVALMRQFLQFDRHWSDVTNTADMTQYFDLSPTPIAEAFEKVYLRVGEDFAKQTWAGLKSHHGYRIKDIEFSPFEEFIRAWVATYGAKRIDDMTKTTQGMLAKLVQQAIDEGMGVAKAQAFIRSRFTDMSKIRAERIARTEIVSASNLGSIEAARSTGLNLQKNWLSTRDGRTRTLQTGEFDHLSVDGQPADLNGFFNVSGEDLMYPGDINGSPGNVINCRCTVTYTEIGEKSHRHELSRKDIDLRPTEPMAEEAKRGLAWREEFGRGGTEIGVARARDISNRKNLSPETINRMVSYFARHEVDKRAEGFRPGEDGYPSAGRIAWALWGGDPGKAWAERKQTQLENQSE